VNLSGAIGGTITDGQGVGTIRNDDGSTAKSSEVARRGGRCCNRGSIERSLKETWSVDFGSSRELIGQPPAWFGGRFVAPARTNRK
jgi:hypothetical protein